MYCAEEGSTYPKHKKVKREESLGLYVLEGYSEISLSSEETSLALWLCRPGSNLTYSGMRLAEKSILVCTNHDKHSLI